MKKNNFIVAAAVSGILGAAIMTVPSTAKADDAAKGKCWGANSCKTTGDCGAKDKSHDCAGKNACKGKGWKKMTEAECAKAKADNKDKKVTIKFEKA